MKEQEYVNVSNLGNLKNAKKSLNSIILNDCKIFNKIEFRELLSKINEWEQKLEKTIIIEESK